MFEKSILNLSFASLLTDRLFFIPLPLKVARLRPILLFHSKNPKNNDDLLENVHRTAIAVCTLTQCQLFGLKIEIPKKP